MPRFIGCTPPQGAQGIATEDIPNTGKLVKLTYSQMRLMDPTDVYYVLDTSDRGGPGLMAKRWYRWYATRAAIALNPRSTPSMKKRAAGV